MFSLFSRPYLDTCSKNYYNIVVLNCMPEGPLRHFVRRVQFPPLSTFKGYYGYGETCGLALMTMDPRGSKLGLMVTDEVPALFSYLTMNNYTIDTSLTKMTIMTGLKFKTENADSLIAFVKYHGSSSTCG
jgi:hypothetical protein